ncbi:MAG: 2-phospho-L-lactate guanylyltransferase [Methanosphaera sp.]|nr:2-phospho-L-lactate guanylyltransferase [Methanosphaera sp.]
MKNLIAIIPVSCFEDSKTRLSPFLSPSERIELLKVMLKDIVIVIRKQVDEIFIVSRDDNVKTYADELNVNFIREKVYDDDFLNHALNDAIKDVKGRFPCNDILILPSDIPLIKEEHVATLHSMDNDLIISPSKGGGTNLLCFNNEFDFHACFGDMSYFKHINLASELGMSINLIESFYVSLDMNTPEDLGELLLHGIGTYTYEFLRSINIMVSSNHGRERLNVTRDER